MPSSSSTPAIGHVDVKSKLMSVISIDLELVALIAHEEGGRGGGDDLHVKKSVSLSEMEVKVKTKWVYMSIPVPQPSSPTKVVTLPNYESSAHEPLFLFLEVWKKGHFHGLCECNLRHVIDSENGAKANMIKWLPIYNPILNQVVGKTLLSLDVGVLKTALQKPIASPVLELVNQMPPSRSVTPTSSYFPLRKHASPDSTVTISRPPSSASTTNKSSPLHSEGSRPSTQGSVEFTDVDIIEILNGKLDSLNQSLQTSKTFRSSHKAGSHKIGSPIPKSRTTSSTMSQNEEKSVSCTKIKDPVVTVLKLNPQFPKKRRTMAAAVAKFTDPPSTST